jgi:predicted O-methyltransferase YrrM
VTKDLRPRASLGRIFRPRSHWTAPYLFYRVRSLLRARLRPADPSLTWQSIRLLSRRLRPDDIGAEWGSGNSTRWLAQRTKHLVSFEAQEAYYSQVKAALVADGIDNVDYRLIPYADLPKERDIHESAWVRGAQALHSESLDYALVDTSPRGCLSLIAANKVKPGGMVVLDNANWYFPPPAGIAPQAPGTIPHDVDDDRRQDPDIECWRAFRAMTRSWEHHWTSDGIQMTLILTKPS